MSNQTLRSTHGVLHPAAACALILLVARPFGLGAQQRSTGPNEPLCLWLQLVANPDGADPAEWGRVHHPPDTVTLEMVEVRGRTGRTWYRLSPPIGGRDDPRPALSPGWRAIGDSLEMVWNNLLTGVHLRGRLRDGSYRGEAFLITDVITPTPIPSAHVVGGKVPCKISNGGRVEDDRDVFVPDGDSPRHVVDAGS